MPSALRTNKNTAGELMEMGVADAARTGLNGEAVTPIIPGVFVALLAGASTRLEVYPVTLPVSAASQVVGVCKRWMLKDNHPPKDQLAFFHRGKVGVWVATAVKGGDPVFAIFTPGATQGWGTNVLGANAVAVANCRYEDDCPANDVAIVSLLLP